MSQALKMTIGEADTMKKQTSNLTVFFLATLILLAVSCGKRDSGGAKPDLPEAGGGVAAELIAVVSSQGGQEATARVMKPGGTQWEAVKVGHKVLLGHSLSVENTTNAMVHLKTGEELALNAGTTVTFASPTEIDIEQGEIWVNTSLSSSPDKLVFRTKKGNVTIEGTIADLRVRENTLRVSVISGKAKIVGEGGEIEIHGGEEAVLEPDQTPALAPVKDPGMLAAWTESVRREIQRTMSKEGEEQAVPRGLGTLSARVPGGKKDLPFAILSEDVTVKIIDQIALTKVEQVFQNPTGSTVEGTYKFPIPYGARMNRFDMEINGKMMQGEIVEREKGRKIMAKVIQQFVDMMRDPALVEWESGSTFKTRIFPILGKQKKRIVLSYVQSLEGEGGRYRYVLPVATPGAAAPVVPDLKLHAEVTGTSGSPIVNTPLYPSAVKAAGGKVGIDFTAKDFSPVVDFVIDVDSGKRPEADMVTYGKKQEGADEEVKTLLQKLKAEEGAAAKGMDYFLVSMRPEVEAKAAKPQDIVNWIFLVDTSQSRTVLDAQMQKRLVEAVLGNLSREDRVKVIAFDAAATVLSDAWEVPSRQFADRMDDFLDSIQPAGATNLEGALLSAAAQLGGVRGARIVLIGDGAATLGENRPKELAQWAHDLFNESRSTVTTIGIGSSIDSLLMEELAVRTGGKAYYLSSGEDLVTSAVKIITSLRIPLLRDVSVSFEGLEVADVYPDKVPNLASGQEIVVTGRYRGTGKLDVRLAGKVGDKDVAKTFSFSVGEGKQGNSFVPILWASRKIDALTLEGGPGTEKDVVKLSKQFSLPSRYTSFIVLENEAMYKEFNVQQDKDRVEWSGEGDIEYEEAAPGGEDEAEQQAESGGGMDLGGLNLLGSAGGGKMGASLADKDVSAQAPASKAEASWDSEAPKEEKSKGAASTPSPGPAKTAAKPKAKKSMRASEPAMFDDIGSGGYSGGGYYYAPPKPQHYVTVYQKPVQMESGKKQATIIELKNAAAKEPLVRTHRIKLVRFLMSVGEYDEAFAAAREWYAMDGGNAQAMLTMGDLVRLRGDLVGAMRYYSGVLDVSPEKTDVMEKLATYFEGRGMWEDAYPFRAIRSLVKPSDKKAAALWAVAAARVGRWEDARKAAAGLFSEDGTKLKAGVSLPSELREALLKVAAMEKSPSLFEKNETSPSGAKFTVELTWEKPVNLDLWVLNAKGEFLGGGGDKGDLLVGESGSEGEVFLMKKPKDGTYKVQVACGDTRSCGDLEAKLVITAWGKTRTINLVIRQGWGMEAASVKLSTINFSGFRY
jgi:Mg-chelatase subunit ChlD